jgi:hypothetical protein
LDNPDNETSSFELAHWGRFSTFLLNLKTKADPASEMLLGFLAKQWAMSKISVTTTTEL